jgi:hypothetical protein
MRRAAAALFLLSVGCGSGQEAAPPQQDAAPPPEDATTSDATLDAGADVTDAISAFDAPDARDAAPDASKEAGTNPFCLNIDAGTILVCETFDEGTTIPQPFAATDTIGAKLEITDAQALSAPNSARVSFTDAGDYSSATGTTLKATFPNGLPRGRLAFAVYLGATFDGEVDVSAVTWSSASASYRVRFGVNGGTFWTFDSTNIGYASPTPFPSGHWYRVVIEVDIPGKHFSIVVGGVPIFDYPTAPPAFTPTAVELNLGVAALATNVTVPAAVLVDDVLFTSF